MTYRVKSCFRTLQGEGARAGRVIVLCRLTGCNLWSGRQEDRAEAACRFCDTDFVGTDGPGGGRFDAPSLAEHLRATWEAGVSGDPAAPFVVFTGGEPLLQLDPQLVDACHRLGLEVGVETNGTLPCPSGVDWVCVSPKAGAALMQRYGDELKLVFPQPGLDPRTFESLDFGVFSLQPLDDDNREANTRQCIAYCLAHPRWRLSVQMHKWVGVP
ncbi:MAG: 7-carboxy-7-deazaguanine synthase [Myxococcota bacterium]